MIRCPSCGQEIGMSRRCRECLKHMVSEKSGEINTDRAARIVELILPWEKKEGISAPEPLKAKVRVLGKLVQDAIDSRSKLPWGLASRAAFAVHYVISAQDWAPDSLPGVGWQDDEAVVSIVLETERDGILEYCRASGVAPAAFGME